VTRCHTREAATVVVNGTLRCTPDHKFWLTGHVEEQGRVIHSGWREVARAVNARALFVTEPVARNGADYERGWLAGMADGDGTFWTLRRRRGYRRFRLALKTPTLLDRARVFAARAGHTLRPGIHNRTGFTGQGSLPCLWLTRDEESKSFETWLQQDVAHDSWRYGYLGGILDAEGSLSGREMRIAQHREVNPTTWVRIQRVLEELGLRYSAEPTGFYVHRSHGAAWRVLSNARPGKQSILDAALGHHPNTTRTIRSVEPSGRHEPVVTLSTTAGSFIAGGYVVKNCDTPYTSWEPEGDERSVDEVLAAVDEEIGRTDRFPLRHVVVTGGEPLIAPGIEDLCAGLRRRGLHITIETAATTFKPVPCDLASLSPKLSSSTPHDRDQGRFAAPHERLRLRPDVIRAWMEHADYQLKFVIDRREDVAEVLRVLEELPGVDRSRLLLMPQGVEHDELARRAQWLIEECKKYGFRYCPRTHIEVYGNQRGR
jgi:7-carboxy-7-deazaguanine synthase